MNTLSISELTRTGIDDLADIELVLRNRHPLRLDRASGKRVRCISGCVWITAPGVVADIFLKAGASWCISGQGRVLVEAVGCATVTVGR